MIPMTFFAIIAYCAYIRISEYVRGEGDLF